MSIRFVTFLTTTIKPYFICHDVSSVNSCQSSEAHTHAPTPVQVAQTIKRTHSNCGNHQTKKITFYVCIRFAGLLSDAQCSTAFLLIQYLCIVINNLVTRQRNLWGKKRHAIAAENQQQQPKYSTMHRFSFFLLPLFLNLWRNINCFEAKRAQIILKNMPLNLKYLSYLAHFKAYRLKHLRKYLRFA